MRTALTTLTQSLCIGFRKRLGRDYQQMKKSTRTEPTSLPSSPIRCHPRKTSFHGPKRHTSNLLQHNPLQNTSCRKSLCGASVGGPSPNKTRELFERPFLRWTLRSNNRLNLHSQDNLGLLRHTLSRGHIYFGRRSSRGIPASGFYPVIGALLAGVWRYRGRSHLRP